MEPLTPEPLDPEKVEYLLKYLVRNSERHDLLYYFKRIPPEHQQRVYDILRARLESPETPREEIERDIWMNDYETKPISIEEFLQSEYHIGKWYKKNLFPRWKSEIVKVLRSGSIEWVLGGAIGIGKCQREGTWIFTADGPMQIEHLHQLADKPHAQSESGLRTIVQSYDEGEILTKRVTTRHGHWNEGSPHHRLRVLGPDLRPEWRQLDELNLEDVLLMTPSVSFGQGQMPDALAELIGWFIAEGTRRSDTPNTARFDLHEDELQYVSSLAVSAGFKARTVETDRIVYVTGSDGVDKWFPTETSHFKKVPECILRSDRRAVCMFLRGLFSGDGYSGECECSLTTMSGELAETVRVLLTGLGLYCSVAQGVASYRLPDGQRVETGTKYTVRVVGPDSQARFADEIGFAQDSKQKMLERRVDRWTSNADHSFAFRLSEQQYLTLRAMQPVGAGSKTSSPRGLMKRLRTQRCTVRLLREILGAGGKLPDTLMQIAQGDLLFDTVARVESSSAHCYDLTVDGDPSYVSGGFISHNTSAAMLATMYKLYVITCMKDPCDYYTANSIVFGLFSVTRDLSKDVESNMLKTRLSESEYFRRVIGITEEVDNPRQPQSIILRFPKNIKFVFGSRAMHALGQDVFGAIMDEVAFSTSAEGKQVHELYTSIKSRIESRYMTGGGRIPGLLCVASSANKEGDFIDQHLKNSVLRDKTHISTFALYEMKNYPGDRFRVLVGDQTQNSRLLDRVEIDHENDEVRVIPMVAPEDIPEGSRIEHVPVQWFGRYEENIEKSIKDISGIPIFSASPFFPNRRKIYELIDDQRSHPFTIEEPTLSLDDDTVTLEGIFELNKLFRKPDPYDNRYQMILNPGVPRFFHVDLAKTKDAAGLACCHLYGFREVSAIDKMGKPTKAQIPYIFVDFMLRILPPKGSQIEFSKIISFIFYLQKMGCPVQSVTADRYQSTQLIQVFKKSNIESAEISMDRTPTAYETLGAALNSGCISYYRYETFLREFTGLQRDPKTGRGDHTPTGSKDVLDAVAGAHYACVTSKYTEMQMADAEMHVRTISQSAKNQIADSRKWVSVDYEDIDRVVDIFDDSGVLGF